MPKRALAEHRPYLLFSIIVATAYFFLRDDPIGGLWLMLLKGSFAALLALYAAHRGPGKTAYLIAAVMALSAIGDMAIEISFTAGGAAFFAAHCAAIVLYLGNRRAQLAPTQIALAVVLLIATPIISYFLAKSAAVGLYGLALGAMAASAWISRFPRYRVGLGAVLFVFSDWLLFSQQSILSATTISQWLVWPLYCAGQFMIATGVVQTLRHELPSSAD